MSQLLKSFIIGASPFIFVPFYIGVTNIPENIINLKTYPVKASLYFGFMNMLSAYYGMKVGLSLRQRLLWITMISIIMIWIIITVTKPYDFKTQQRWILQYIITAMAHVITFMFIIYNLELILDK